MIKPTHALLTICAPMPRDPELGFIREADVEALIDGLGNPALSPFRDRLNATGIIHFVSLSVIRTTQADEPSFLVMEMSADGEAKHVITALCDAIGDELLVIYRRACGVDNLDQLRGFLNKHNRQLSQSYFRSTSVIGLPFIGLDGLTVERIKTEREVVFHARDAIRALLIKNPTASALTYVKEAGDVAADKVPGWRTGYSKRTDQDLKFVDSDDAPWLKQKIEATAIGYLRLVPELRNIVIGVPLALAVLTFAYLLIPPFGAAPSPGWWVSAIIGFFFTLSTSFPLALVVLIGTGLWLYKAFRDSEERNTPNDLDPDPAVIRELGRRENHPAFVQNHMISVCDVVPEFSRRNITLPFAMRTIRTALEQGLFRGGFLSDIGTIHYARWVLLPGTSKLVFFSNYDGSWESYLEDFITKASHGLTGVWSNCSGFPKTKRLFMEGATDGDRFKRWARRSMIPTRFWYSAYPDLTAQQIRTNAMICDGLRKVSTATDAEAWLELFDSIPRPEANLEYDEIQKLLLSGVGELPEGRCLAVSFNGSDKAGQWISELLGKGKIVFAQEGQRSYDAAMFLALSASGMAALGVDEARADRPEKHTARANFPTPFVLGMHDESRRRILSDHAAGKWGGAEDREDAVLLIYGFPEEIDSLVAEEKARLLGLGLSCFHTIVLESFGKNKSKPPPDGPIIVNITADEEKEATALDREPFGYVDGISQPITYKSGSSKTNPLHDVQAGEFILGYRDNRNFFPPSLLLPAEKDPHELLPGPPSQLPKRWPHFQRAHGKEQSTRDLGRNGSFLVIRQLEQHVDEFNEWLLDVAKTMTGFKPTVQPGFVDARVELAAATVMGRWRDGASIVNVPSYSPDEPIDNDFVYGRDDPQGHRCPFGAHIRRSNPRDSLNPGSAEEIGIVNRHRILRRGRAYRDEEKRGLLFMCFNADIERQFEFVQQNWINASSHHGLRNEYDPVASHVGPCTFTMPASVGPPKRVDVPKAFVTVRGGGYFFLPSKSALKYLATLVPAAPPAAAAIAPAIAPPPAAGAGAMVPAKRIDERS